jgi:hypothetical protein
MLYDSQQDLYELLGVRSDCSEGQILARIDSLRGQIDDALLDRAVAVLLDLQERTRYDSQRATHRLRLMLRESVGVFSGRTPAFGVPIRSRDES